MDSDIQQTPVDFDEIPALQSCPANLFLLALFLSTLYSVTSYKKADYV